MFKIFLCHRTSDAGYAASHIYQELAEVFGEGNVFEYNDAMPAGVDFRQHVIDQLQQMQVFVPLIGPQWLDSRDERGELRLMQSDDPVRVEIETALNMPTLRILPVFLHGISSLPKSKLPINMARLMDISAIHIGQKPQELKQGVNRLIEAIRTAGIHPRPDPNPEIKKLKTELLELEAEKKTKENILVDCRRKWIAACIAMPLSLGILVNILDPESRDTFAFLILICIIVFVIAFRWYKKYNPKKNKAELDTIEKQILTVKSRLITLEGKGG
jgi:TIR domain